ncbi:MAG: hemerythrin domain-containing protein [Planctomycetes bacterium]|nr:hemerythrin domain-containing protein [Planctomycetota bacterium]
MERASQVLCAMHARLLEEFELQQHAWIEREAQLAAARLASFARHLRAHALAEHAELLRGYATFECERRDSAQVFEAEHERVEQLLRRVEGDVASAQGLAPSAASILARIERQATFKHLLEHHFLREERVLAPRLELEWGEAAARAAFERVRELTFVAGPA